MTLLLLVLVLVLVLVLARGCPGASPPLAAVQG
jgi:hypothetical protein